MKFAGLQKVSLLDYPGLVACTVFTQGCNFRCPFCHNASLVLGKNDAGYTDREILDYLRKRQGVLDGVVISGGEPLLHEELEDFLMQVKELGYRIKLDTNGSNPAALRKLVEKGLIDRVAMDIKNSPDDYGKTVGRLDFDITPIEQSKAFLLSGAVEFEFRTTVVKGLHTRQSLIQAAQWISGAENYFLQGFRDQGDLIAPNGLQAYSKEEMDGLLEAVREYIPNAALRGFNVK